MDIEPIVPAVDPPALAYHRFDQLRSGLRSARRSLADIAEACYEIQQGKLWKDLGSEYETLNDFLADPDLKMKRREFFRFAGIHEALVLRKGVEPEQLEVASEHTWEIVQVAANDPTITVEELVSDVEMLGARDLREKYRGANESADAPAARCETCGQTLRRAA